MNVSVLRSAVNNEQNTLSNLAEVSGYKCLAPQSPTLSSVVVPECVGAQHVDDNTSTCPQPPVAHLRLSSPCSVHWLSCEPHTLTWNNKVRTGGATSSPSLVRGSTCFSGCVAHSQVLCRHSQVLCRPQTGVVS